ncbi:RNA polymerase sigma factor [Pseudomonas chlororaphis]|uniref:RNA polymerase sigma factor n=1 Tax=Pseudomonas chlororaphis TaxID=587753 RepID=UPI000F584C01|nr:sigma-70 family RNA polymerase sigma factor [Pseudomonas chlororaphis]AZC84000.1 HrpL [Pseudomonas chlororaphis subsp. piscium]
MELNTVQTEAKVIGAIKLDLEGLARRSERKLRCFINKRVFNQADIDDLMQMTYLEAWCNRHKFIGASRPETWLFGIAANLVRNYFKNLYNRPRCLALEESEIDSLEHGHDPSQLSEHQRLLSRTQEAIEGLPVDMRTVINLVVDSDISYQEAARQLRVPVGTVRSRLARARSQLKMSICGKRAGA